MIEHGQGMYRPVLSIHGKQVRPYIIGVKANPLLPFLMTTFRQAPLTSLK